MLRSALILMLLAIDWYCDTGSPSFCSTPTVRSRTVTPVTVRTVRRGGGGGGRAGSRASSISAPAVVAYAPIIGGEPQRASDQLQPPRLGLIAAPTRTEPNRLHLRAEPRDFLT